MALLFQERENILASRGAAALLKLPVSWYNGGFKSKAQSCCRARTPMALVGCCPDNFAGLSLVESGLVVGADLIVLNPLSTSGNPA